MRNNIYGVSKIIFVNLFLKVIWMPNSLSLFIYKIYKLCIQVQYIINYTILYKYKHDEI